MIAQRRGGRHEISCVQVGKGLRQLIEGTAEQLDVQRVSEVSDEGGLGGLLFHVATEVCSPHPSAQELLFLAEEVLGHVIDAADHGEDGAAGRTHRGVTEEMGSVTPQIGSDGVGRRGTVALEALLIGREGLLDLMEPGELKGGQLQLAGATGCAGKLGVGEAKDVSELTEGLPRLSKFAHEVREGLGVEFSGGKREWAPGAPLGLGSGAGQEALGHLGHLGQLARAHDEVQVGKSKGVGKILGAGVFEDPLNQGEQIVTHRCATEGAVRATRGSLLVAGQLSQKGLEVRAHVGLAQERT